MPADSVFDDSVTNLLSVLCILIYYKSFHLLMQRERKALMISNLALLLVIFQVTVVKGLSVTLTVTPVTA